MFNVCTLGLTTTQSLNQYYCRLPLSAPLSSSRTGNSSVKGAIHVNLISIFWRIIDTLQIYIYIYMTGWTAGRPSFLFPSWHLSPPPPLSRQTVYYSRRIERTISTFEYGEFVTQVPCTTVNLWAGCNYTSQCLCPWLDSLHLIAFSLFFFVRVCVCYRIFSFFHFCLFFLTLVRNI